MIALARLKGSSIVSFDKTDSKKLKADLVKP
jgi:hypothetical protein